MPTSRTRYSWTHTDLAKVSDRKPRSASGEWTIEDLVQLTGLPPNTLRQYQVRGEFNPNKLASVVLFLARWGKQDLRETLVRSSVMEAPKKAGSVPDSLRGVVEWMASHGNDQFKHKILRSAMGGNRKSGARSAKK
jgi:hypothetical protein